MKIKNITYLAIILFTVVIFTGCATVFKGYEDRVDLIDAPDNIQVYTADGIEIPVSSRFEKHFSYEEKKYYDKEIKTISLRSGKDHLLMLKIGDKEKLIEVYPRLGGGWLIIDMITIVPALVDGYTGSWNHFKPIVVVF